MTATRNRTFEAECRGPSNLWWPSHLAGGLVPSDYCPKFEGIKLETPEVTESQTTTERLTWQTI